VQTLTPKAATSIARESLNPPRTEAGPDPNGDPLMPRVATNTAASTIPHKEPVTRLIRTTRQATRRRYLPDEKIRIVMEGIRGDEPISDLFAPNAARQP
jgi:hypothetical protein